MHPRARRNFPRSLLTYLINTIPLRRRSYQPIPARRECCHAHHSNVTATLLGLDFSALVLLVQKVPENIASVASGYFPLHLTQAVFCAYIDARFHGSDSASRPRISDLP